MTLATTLLKIFLRGHVRTVPRNMHIKCEVCSFNRFGAHTDTSNEDSISAVHSIHLAEIISLGSSIPADPTSAI